MNGDVEVIRRGRPARGTPVYVGRPGVLGNPYSHTPTDVPGVLRVESRDIAVDYYRSYIAELPADSPQWREIIRIATMPGAISLICWCAPKRCHGDIIAEAVRALRQGQAVEAIVAAWRATA